MLATKLDVAKLVGALTTPDGGFSADPSGSAVTAGFAVSIHPECERVLVAPVSDSDLESYVADHAATLALPGRVFGGWHDPADGRIYLDVSVVVDTEEEAARLAFTASQLAYFDLGSGSSVRLVEPAA